MLIKNGRKWYGITYQIVSDNGSIYAIHILLETFTADKWWGALAHSAMGNETIIKIVVLLIKILEDASVATFVIALNCYTTVARRKYSVLPYTYTPGHLYFVLPHT